MICEKNPDIKCGGEWRNSVYDITSYEVDPCIWDPKDCTFRGGYDPEDICK